MSKRFGKRRAPDCTCEYNFTCRACLDLGVLIEPAVHAAPAPQLHPLTTHINGQPADWDRPIWELWYTHVDRADPKLYDTHGIPVAANWMPAGRTSACFSFTLKDGRTFHQVIP